MPHARTPVLVGVAQLEQRFDDPYQGAEPLDMMLDALSQAAEDCGVPAILGEADSVRVIQGIWDYENPAGEVARRIGADGAETVGTPLGGNMVQTAVSDAALGISRGELDVVVLCGAENGRSQARARKQGRRYSYSEAPGRPSRMLGSDHPMVHPAELERRIVQPIQLYPMFENAIRYARGESLEAHLRRISELWAGFNRVAVDNPHATLRTPLSAEEIRTPGPRNRMVGFPYPKLMNSNNAVDQGAALILCSLSRAEALGCHADKFVFPLAGSDAHDHYAVSNRADLHSSPAIRLAGAEVLRLAEMAVRDIDYVDVYSCFPSAVQVACAELGLPEDRVLTVTGGLTFAGGPLNNYVMHAIATMAEVLRADRGKKGLVTANGGFLTKHAFGVYCSEPADFDFRHADVQADVDALPRRDVVSGYAGAATLESYTVMYSGEGPAQAFIAALLPDGRRCWATSDEAPLMEAMTREEFCGRAVRVDPEGRFSVS